MIIDHAHCMYKHSYACHMLILKQGYVTFERRNSTFVLKNQKLNIKSIKKKDLSQSIRGFATTAFLGLILPVAYGS